MSAPVAGGSVELEISLGLGMTAGTGRWDDPAAQFGITRWADPDTTLGDWFEITCSCLGLRLQMGGHEPDPLVPLPVAGTAALVIYGPQYDPWTGPWAGVIGEGVLARILARPPGGSSFSTVIAGSITRYAYDPMSLTAEMELTDNLLLLNSDLPALAAPIGSGETAAARIGRLLDRAGWTGGRDITAGGVPMLPTTLDGAAITTMRTTAESDLGLLGMRRAGTIAYRPGAYQPVIPVQGTVTVCPIDPAGQTPPIVRLVTLATRQDGELLNVAAISRQSDEGTEADTATYRDESSVARFGPRTYKRTDLQHQDTAQSQRIASELVARGAWPSQPPADFELSTQLDPAAGMMLLTIDPLTRLRLIGESGATQDVIVSGWEVDLDADSVVGSLIVAPIITVEGAVFDRAAWDTDRWEAA